MTLPSDNAPATQRLQVFLSHNGVCSRREAMKIIQDGLVTVNGKLTTEPSMQIDPSKDRVAVQGRVVRKESYEYILLNKPQGYVTTTADVHAEQTVLDLLPRELKHLNPVGRLDKDTEGLLLLTNDGDVAYQLTHPKFNVDKTYFVRINGLLKIEEQKNLEKGIVVEGQKTAPATIRDLKTTPAGSEFYLTIHEGRKRQIRYMLWAVGHKVTYLKRLRQGPLSLGDLKLGAFRNLTPQEIDGLKKLKEL